MTIKLAIASPGLLLWAAAGAAAPSTEADTREILRTVIAFEVRTHAAAEVGPPPCVRRRVAASRLARRRSEVERYERRASARRPHGPVAPGSLTYVSPVTVVNSEEIVLSPFSGWHRPAAVNSGYVERGGDVTSEEDARLLAAERAALTAPSHPRPVRRIDSAWLGPPLVLCSDRDALPAIEIDTPVIVGDIALVPRDFHCVLCGQGVIYALRRAGPRWEIVAVALKWQS